MFKNLNGHILRLPLFGQKRSPLPLIHPDRPYREKRGGLGPRVCGIWKVFNQRLLDFRQMCICSADWISSSRKLGWAMPIRASARSQVDRPFRFTMPYSVTI